jgi:hypothetical protein
LVEGNTEHSEGFRQYPLSRVASIALALWHFGFSVSTPISRQRTANVHRFLEFTLTIPADVTF